MVQRPRVDFEDGIARGRKDGRREEGKVATLESIPAGEVGVTLALVTNSNRWEDVLGACSISFCSFPTDGSTVLWMEAGPSNVLNCCC